MRITIELLGWVLTWAAEQGQPIADGERGNATSYPVPHVEALGEPTDDRARFGLGGRP